MKISVVCNLGMKNTWVFLLVRSLFWGEPIGKFIKETQKRESLSFWNHIQRWICIWIKNSLKIVFRKINQIKRNYWKVKNCRNCKVFSSCDGRIEEDQVHGERLESLYLNYEGSLRRAIYGINERAGWKTDARGGVLLLSMFHYKLIRRVRGQRLDEPRKSLENIASRDEQLSVRLVLKYLKQLRK